MGSRNTVKWRKPIILGGVTYLVIVVSIFLHAEFERYAIVPVSRDDWPGIVFLISENAKAKYRKILVTEKANVRQFEELLKLTIEAAKYEP